MNAQNLDFDWNQYGKKFPFVANGQVQGMEVRSSLELERKLSAKELAAAATELDLAIDDFRRSECSKP